jgi:antirestriction protein
MATATLTTTTTETTRIYVACLAAYNSGILHGAWIDAAQEPWAIYDDVQAMLAASPIAEAEEWAIHDHTGFGGATIEEYTGFERVSELAAFIAEHGALGAAVLEHFCGDLDEAREAIEDRYHGCHTSLADYVQELTEDTTTIPEALRYYIDYQAMARDVEISGDFFTISTAWNEVHVFAGC